MQMPKNDTGDLLKELGDNAKEVLAKFGEIFAISCGCNLLESVTEEIEKKREQKRRHTRRLTPYEKVDEDGLEGRFRKELWMKVGGGAGDFGEWKKVFVVQEESFDLTIYESEKHADDNKKPIAVIRPAGYEITTDVKQHYQDDIKSLIHDIREVDVDNLTTDLEEYTWALTHAVRPNYVFLARPSKVKARSKISMICSCGKKKIEPEKVVEETEEERIKREQAIESMRKCIDCAQPRDKTELVRKSFEMTIRQLPHEIEGLRDDWTDDGTESEILVDLLMEVCMANRRNKILNERKGPPIIRIKWWNKIRKSVHKLLSKLVDEAWSAARCLFKEVREQIEPTIRAGLAPIAEFRLTAEEKINELILNRLGELLGEFVSPFIKPLLELFETPFRESLEDGRKLLEEKLNPDNLPADIKERENYLESLIKERQSRGGLYQRLDNMESALEKLRSLNTASTKVLQGVRLAKLRTRVETAVNEILDAAIHSYKIRLNPNVPSSVEAVENGSDRKEEVHSSTEGIINRGLDTDQDKSENNAPINSSPAEIYRQVLVDFDHDVMLVRSEFVKTSVHNLLLEAFHKIVDPHIKPIVNKIDQAIPEEFQKFISLPALLDKIVDRVVWVPVEKAVEVSYPVPED